jgi:TetR/AcrR family acrAB operon transcriptional repressor
MPDREVRILAAAGRIIVHFGYNKTTIDDIAREAGVSKGAVYLHWKSKEELLSALLIHEMERLLDDLSVRITADPAGGTLAHMYRHSLLALQDNPLIRALYTQDSRILGDYMRRQDPARYTDRFLFGTTFVQLLQTAGLIRTDLSPAVISYLMSIIAYGFIGIETIIPATAAPPLEEVTAALTAFVQDGLARPDGDSAVGKRALLEMIRQVKRQYHPEDSSTEQL